MSSRLVLLPKKSYCPWNPKNVERVEHDEAAHREKQQAEAQRQLDRESEQRWSALKHTDASTESQHVNLFEWEEKKHAEALSVQARMMQDDNKHNGEPMGGAASFGKLFKDEKSRPFYLKENPYQRDDDLDARELKRKSLHDPLHFLATRHRSETALVIHRHPNNSTVVPVETHRRHKSNPREKLQTDESSHCSSSSSSTSSSRRRRKRSRKERKWERKEKKRRKKHR
jgi:hypothetical protein